MLISYLKHSRLRTLREKATLGSQADSARMLLSLSSDVKIDLSANHEMI